MTKPTQDKETLREAVARAICEAEGYSYIPSEHYDRLADAAIATTIEQKAREIAAEHGDPHDYDHSWRLVRIGIIEGVKMAYKVALEAEQQQDNDYGAANTGGAQEAADTIRALIEEQKV